MAFKINIGTPSGQTFKLETEAPGLIDKKLKEKVSGKTLSNDFEGYEFEITGASDKSGFTALESVEGIGRKKVLLSYEKGMNKRPKYEGKKKRSDYKPKGLKLRKTVRGNTLSEEIIQVNLKLLREGNKKLTEIFPDQNKAPESQVNENSEEKKE